MLGGCRADYAAADDKDIGGTKENIGVRDFLGFWRHDGIPSFF
jgi:hypothetical protein